LHGCAQNSNLTIQMREVVTPNQHTVYLALGSNLGDRAANVQRALRLMAPFARVEATSFLYETPPAYITDQPAFLNAVCRAVTGLPPHVLLDRLQDVERTMGRQRTVRYGPRLIDLDILFYDDVHVEQDDLAVPHPRLAERDFVLEPLCDLAPDLRHPVSGDTVQEMWSRLGADPLPRALPLGGHLWTWGRKTYVMGVINVTPDSFSGDGIWGDGAAERAAEQAVQQARRFVEEGADCVDVGGQSTRPGHALVPVDEEMARVLPAVRALREAVDVPVSVDTFRGEVAREALRAGAHMVNDVWALRFDAGTGHAAAESGAALALMHNSDRALDDGYPLSLRRGIQPSGERPPSGDLQASRKVDENMDEEDIVLAIRVHLAERLAAAQSMGVARWQLIADPGIGFGKELRENLEIIRRLGEIKGLGYPLLFGSSRKGFIGRVLGGLSPDQRVEGTLATCVLAVAQGADIVRVHDVQAAVRAVRMADAVVRGPNVA
jgi:2-amino-4-hydroxy-6-hydroxymethyldihydropteridine diphosphokinase